MRRSKVAAFAAVGLGISLGAACSLEDGGVIYPASDDGSVSMIDGGGSDGQPAPHDASPAGDSSPSTDSGSDAATLDAGSDAAPPGTYSCGGTAVPSCVGCAGAPVECPTTSTCVANCGLCNLTTLFECDACYADGGLAVQRCEAQSGTAFAECLSGFNRCPCTTESNCPGGNQTCESGECFECGEPDAGAQDGEKCKAGPMAAKCHAAAGATFGTCF